MLISVQKLDPKAILPSRKNYEDAGNDLHALTGGHLLSGQRVLVSTGIAVAIPAGWYGRVAPRSGLAVKCGVDVLAGVIDSTFRGEIKVALINLDKELPFIWGAGDRIAQLVIEKCEHVIFNEVDTLIVTARGEGGFGSTGK